MFPINKTSKLQMELSTTVSVLPTNPTDGLTEKSSNTLVDSEQQTPSLAQAMTGKVTGFKALGWLDRFLALWILLAMAIGIILGNFVPSTGPALQKSKFVGVSVPIGNCFILHYVYSIFFVSFVL